MKFRKWGLNLKVLISSHNEILKLGTKPKVLIISHNEILEMGTKSKSVVDQFPYWVFILMVQWDHDKQKMGT